MSRPRTGVFTQHVAAASIRATNVTSLSAVAEVAVPAGQTLLFTGTVPNAAGTPAITDSRGNTWTIDLAHGTTAARNVVARARLTTDIEVGDEITLTVPVAATNFSFGIIAVAGLADAAPVATSTVDFSAATTATVAPATPTTSDVYPINVAVTDAAGWTANAQLPLAVQHAGGEAGFWITTVGVGTTQADGFTADPAWTTVPSGLVQTVSVGRYHEVAYAPAPVGADPSPPATWTWAGSASGFATIVGYPAEPPPPPPPPPPPLTSPPVVWDGLALNPGSNGDGTTAVITGMTGWLDSPPLDGHNVDRALADGAIYGPKTLLSRSIGIEGAAAGPRAWLSELHDKLTRRAVARNPAPLTVTDLGTGRTLTADVRADTEQFQQSFIGGHAGFRWTLTLTAADPRLYSDEWQSELLTNGEGEQTGRVYPKTYPWRYAAADLSNSAALDNPGNTPAPVYALFTGPLSESRLTDGTATIHLAELLQDERILVATENLAATAEGGATRAHYFRAGSSAMTIPAETTATWRLYATGGGSVLLSWRATWI